MSETTSSTDWAGARGERWRDHREGLEATLEPVHEPLFEALRIEGPTRIAEVGCGCGGTALELARRVPAGTVVHGYDLSPANVEEARARASEAATEVHFEVADMGTAAPPADPYHRLVSRFGFMFFEEPVPAFRNLTRWLVPGGRLAFATWGAPAENPWMFRIRGAVGELVEIPEADPEGPGPFRYADPDHLTEEFARAGFRELEVTTWRGKLPLGGGVPPAAAAHFALSAFGGLAELLAAAGEAVTARAHAHVTAILAGASEGDAVLMDAAVHIVTGGC